MLDWLTDPLLSVFYPKQCGSCYAPAERSHDGHACTDCWNRTTIFTGKEMLCTKCGAFFGPEASPKPVHCFKCDSHAYERAFSLGIYEHALRSSILGLKSHPNLSGRVEKLILSAAERLGFCHDLILPVPLSRPRLLERGFNQAQVISQFLARSTGIDEDAGSLVRNVHTPIHRVGMDERARELSVRKTFVVHRTKLIAGRTILLVDDVFTSGATASACAAALKKNGAARVDVFTLARAVLR